MPRSKRPSSPPEAIPFRRPPRAVKAGSGTGNFSGAASSGISTIPHTAKSPTSSLSSVPPAKWLEPYWVVKRIQEQTNAMRLATSPLVWLECYGEDLVLSWKTKPALDALLEQIPAQMNALGMPKPCRIFGRHLAREAQLRLPPVLLSGESQLPLETEATEAGVKFGIDFSAGYSVGLFIDQRANRASLAQLLHAKPAVRVLNTFAYTCSFSVVAARFGATTLSLDLSKKSLSRGEQNFHRNSLPLAGHRFIADDVFAVLPRLAKRGELFDAIVLDPPTFSRNQSGEAFQAEQDYPRLIQLALAVAAPGAAILLSTNCTSISPPKLQQMARHALKQSRRSGRFWSNSQPEDIPASQAASTTWLEVN